MPARVAGLRVTWSRRAAVATAEFSSGESLTGTYSAMGAFNLSYASTYTISLPAGPGEPGTIQGSSGGQIADQAGSGTETGPAGRRRSRRSKPSALRIADTVWARDPADQPQATGLHTRVPRIEVSPMWSY